MRITIKPPNSGGTDSRHTALFQRSSRTIVDWLMEPTKGLMALSERVTCWSMGLNGLLTIQAAADLQRPETDLANASLAAHP